MNARKAVEPVCLDVLVRWRGDEETGRDQIDEILREVVIITDSEDSDDSSEDDSSSDVGEDDDHDGETSASSGAISQPTSRNQMRPGQIEPTRIGREVSMREAVYNEPHARRLPIQQQAKTHRDKKTQRGFSRYQAAWEQAVSRQYPSAAKVASPALAMDAPGYSNGESSRNVNYFPSTRASPKSTNATAPQSLYREDSLLRSRPVSLVLSN